VKRRSVLMAAGTGLLALAAPRISRSRRSADAALSCPKRSRRVDPIWNTAYVTRNHGYLVYDTLYGWTRTSRHGRKWSPATPSKTTVGCGR